MGIALKFSLFGSGIGAAAGLGTGAYYGGVLGGMAGFTSGLVLGPPALAATVVIVGLACLVTAAAVAIPCYLGYLLMRETLHLLAECCFRASSLSPS